jgi:hypothetical protein
MKGQMKFLLTIFLSLAIPAALQAQVITYGGGRVSDRQVRRLLTRISTETATFRNEMMRTANRDAMNQNREDRIDNLIDQFSTATTDLNNQYDSRRDVTTEVTNVLQRAAAIDRFMQRNTLNSRVESQWVTLRTDLDSLARYNNVSWNWNTAGNNDTYGNNNTYRNDRYGNGRNGNYGGIDSRLTGTYRLNANQSDNVSSILDRALGSYSVTQRENYRRGLERRLSSPDMLVIEKTGNHVSMASSLAPQIAFDADGVAHTETNQRGRTMTTTVRANNSGMSIQYQGERSNDFNVTFTPTTNGRLRVVRTVYVENENRTVTVASVYDKIDNVARWSDLPTINNNTANYPSSGNYPSGGYDNAFVIPNGTQLTARLNSNLSTRASQSGDRFSMTVTSPYQYNGAVIDGHIENASSSGRLSGRANVTMVFDSVRMPNGQSYRFAGLVNSVRALNGDTVTVNNEGTIRDSNQTTNTATRAGIGAVLGAIIGAVAGGGEGAAIGATVGAGAGAGSVLIQGRDNIELAQGSEFSITAMAPAGSGYIR